MNTNLTVPTEEFLDTTSTSNSSNIILCPYCGASNCVGFKFCWQCGKKIYKRFGDERLDREVAMPS